MEDRFGGKVIADGKRNDGRRSTFTNRGPGSCLPKRTDSVCPWRQAFLMTDIQALVLGIRKECSWRKLAAGDTTVGSTPSSNLCCNLRFESPFGTAWALIAKLN